MQGSSSPATLADDVPVASPSAWAALAAGLLAIALTLAARHGGLRAVRELPHHVEALGARGPVAFALGYALAVVLMVPGSALTLAAGGLFGPVVGTLVVVAGSNGGAAMAFLIARYLARGAVATPHEPQPEVRGHRPGGLDGMGPLWSGF